MTKQSLVVVDNQVLELTDPIVLELTGKELAAAFVETCIEFVGRVLDFPDPDKVDLTKVPYYTGLLWLKTKAEKEGVIVCLPKHIRDYRWMSELLVAS